MSYSEIYSLLVIQGGMDPTYVLDEMQMYELQPLINNLYLKDKESWEQARFIGYITAQVNSTKTLKMSDIISFPWDDKHENKSTTVSKEDIERLRKQAIKYMQENK